MFKQTIKTFVLIIVGTLLLQAIALPGFTEDLELDFEIDLKNENHKISLDIYDDQLLVTISVIFPLPLKAGIDTDEINEWLDDNGGYFAGVANGGWGWGGDEGGQLICIG